MESRESAQYSSNYVEYLVPMKTNGSLLIKKLAIIALLVVLSVVGAVFILNFVPMLMVIYLGLVGILGWFLWRFVSIEFEYSIAMGEMDVDIIYGQRSRKRIVSGVKLKDMSIVAPYCPDYQNEINASDINKRIFAASDINSPDTYFCIYNDAKNGKTLLIFEATKKTLSIMKFYNSTATVVSDHVTH